MAKWKQKESQYHKNFFDMEKAAKERDERAKQPPTIRYITRGANTPPNNTAIAAALEKAFKKN